jgi:putative DNA primase/helicase
VKTAAEIAAALSGYQGGDGWVARCPAHDDRKPSLSLTERDGRILVCCHAGCSQSAVIAALRARGLWPAASGGQKEGRTASRSKIVATYDYLDESGGLLFQSVRYEPKRFSQRRPDGHGGWINDLKGVRRVLYRLPELLTAPPDVLVLIPEGEKDVDALYAHARQDVATALKIAVTCNPCGAGKWREEYNVHLRGRDVVVIPDADEAGRRHADDVIRHLLPVAASVRRLELPA